MGIIIDMVLLCLRCIIGLLTIGSVFSPFIAAFLFAIKYLKNTIKERNDKDKMLKNFLKFIICILSFILVFQVYRFFIRLAMKNYANSMSVMVEEISEERRLSNQLASLVSEEKSINIEEYLPFQKDSLIVNAENSSLKFEKDFPRLDGATALLPIYSAFMNATYPSETCDFNGNKFTKYSYIQKTGTTGAYKAIVDGDTDLIFCAGPSKEQEEYAKENNVELEYVPIGKEAFVFITNIENKVDSLTQNEVRGIYNKEYTNWKEFGGEDYFIRAVVRNEGSGSQTAMDKFMKRNEEYPHTASNISNLVEFKDVVEYPIGYSFRFYIDDIMQNKKVKMIALDGVYPNEENIRNGSYPVIEEFYAIYRKDEKNENVKKLVDWILSEEGQDIINKTGYVGIK